MKYFGYRIRRNGLEKLVIQRKAQKERNLIEICLWNKVLNESFYVRNDTSSKKNRKSVKKSYHLSNETIWLRRVKTTTEKKKKKDVIVFINFTSFRYRLEKNVLINLLQSWFFYDEKNLKPIKIVKHEWTFGLLPLLSFGKLFLRVYPLGEYRAVCFFNSFFFSTNL